MHVALLYNTLGIVGWDGRRSILQLTAVECQIAMLLATHCSPDWVCIVHRPFQRVLENVVRLQYGALQMIAY